MKHEKHPNIGDKFCAAPFTSLYEGQFGKVSACCAMADPIGWTKENTLEEIVNNETSKRLRRDFLNNRYPKECITCSKFEAENNTIADVRKASNVIAHRKTELALDNTLPDGTMIKQTPVWLDLLFTNKCNFACMGCDGELSSTIATKYNEAFAISNGCREDELNSELWSNPNDQKIDYILKHRDTVEKIHLNGGEPFMQESVHELLEVMIKHGLHKSVSIWTHTNGSISTYKGKNIIEDYLAKWEVPCKVTISHDGHGKRGEYVRYGLKQEKWLDTIKRLTDANIQVNIQSCYSVFNALHLVELYDWYATNTTIKPIDRKMNAWYDPIPFTAKFLQADLELLEEANRQIDEIEKLNEKSNWDTSYLRSFLNGKLSAEEIEIGKSRFRRSVDKFDELRKTNFLETFPELENLYLNCSA